MSLELVNSLFDFKLSDPVNRYAHLTRNQADLLHNLFKSHPLFNWQQTHNFCEARAEAISILLECWGIPHYKCWIFGGSFLYKNHVGGLKQSWNYHVAVALPIKVTEEVELFVVDPSTGHELQLLKDWTDAVTALPHSYYVVKNPKYYIFPTGTITRHNWHFRNKQNYRWVIQGLAGINGLSATGKAKLIFSKPRLKKKQHILRSACREKPVFID